MSSMWWLAIIVGQFSHKAYPVALGGLGQFLQGSIQLLATGFAAVPVGDVGRDQESGNELDRRL